MIKPPYRMHWWQFWRPKPPKEMRFTPEMLELLKLNLGFDECAKPVPLPENKGKEIRMYKK